MCRYDYIVNIFGFHTIREQIEIYYHLNIREIKYFEEMDEGKEYLRLQI